MTNREKLLQEISELSDRQLFDLVSVGYCAIAPGRDWGFVICEDCQAEYDGACPSLGDDDDCACHEEKWMQAECRHDRLLEVGT